jgi:glycosyltransferase involved in cell wall biosynthesis
MSGRHRNQVHVIVDEMAHKGIGGINCMRCLLASLSTDVDVRYIRIERVLGWNAIRSQWLRSFVSNLFLLTACPKSHSTIIIDAAFARETWFALRIWKWWNKAVLLGIVHHYTYNIKGRGVLALLHKQAERLFTRILDDVFVNSESTRSQASEFATPGSRIHRFWVPHLRLSQASQEQLDNKFSRKTADDSVRFLFVGGVDLRKGVDQAINAVISYKGNLAVEFHIVGNVVRWGGFQRILDQLLRQDIGRRIRLLGYLEDEEMENQFLSADAFLFPSHWEGYGMAVEDALSFGLPVLTYRVGAVPELVEHGKSGWIVEDSDTAALSKAVECCIENREERERLSYGALQRAHEIASMREPIEKPFLEVINSLPDR